MVTFVGSASVAAFDGEPSATLAGVAEGDLVIWIAGHRTAPTDGAPTTSGSWTRIRNEQTEVLNSSARRSLDVWWGTAPAGVTEWAFNFGAAISCALAVMAFRSTSGGTWALDGDDSDDNGLVVGSSLAGPAAIASANPEGVAVAGTVTRYVLTALAPANGWVESELVPNGAGEFGATVGAAHRLVTAGGSHSTSIDWSDDGVDALATMVVAGLSVVPLPPPGATVGGVVRSGPVVEGGAAEPRTLAGVVRGAPTIRGA